MGTMNLTMALGLVVLLATAGCNPAMRSARKQASVDFGCEAGALEVLRRSHDTYVVSGCDRRGVYQCPEAPGVTSRFCVNLALMARTRGEREFRCDFEQVGVEEISPFVFRVEGCDREALYHCEASDGRPRCLAERSEAPPPVSSPTAAAPESEAATNP